MRRLSLSRGQPLDARIERDNLILVSSSKGAARSSRQLVVAALAGGFCAHLAATVAWVILEDQSTISVLDVPLRAFAWSTFALYMVLVYAAVGGGWLAIVGRVLRWPAKPALTLIMTATTPLIFTAAAMALGWLLTGGQWSLEFNPEDIVVYLLVAPTAFSVAAVYMLRQAAAQT